MSIEEAIQKLDSSYKFYHEWSKTSLQQRKHVVGQILDYFASNSDEIASEVSIQMGKPIKQSKKELIEAQELSKQLMELAESALEPSLLQSKGNFRTKLTKESIGPVLVCTPYTHPVLSVVAAVVPALLCGNTVVLKHSPYTPLTAQRFTKACEQAGVPELIQDCLIPITEFPVLLDQPEVAYLHFSGSSESGRTIYKNVGSLSFMDTGLFLSTKNPVYVAEDTDLDNCVLKIVKNSMYNAGQSTWKFEKVYVHENLIEDFIKRAEPLVKSYTIGDPLDDLTTLGPITVPENLENMRELIEEAVGSDGDLICGGSICNDETGRGRFFEPSLICALDENMRIFVSFT